MSGRGTRDSLSTALGELVRHCDLNPLSRLMLTTLADFSSADMSSAIYPSQLTLAAQLGRSERTVRYLLADLERAGLIHVYRSAPQRTATGFTRTTNRYRIMWKRILNAARRRVPLKTLAGVHAARKTPGRVYRQRTAAYPLRGVETGSPRRPTRAGSHRKWGSSEQNRRVPAWLDGRHPPCAACGGVGQVQSGGSGGYRRCEPCDGYGVIR